ncbi:MAG TPA: hypothetical protein VLJ61_00400 [Pyrinomonadaceae bacterium]|nr:hypothetical protein [Pyrinomonadaceae bacterium]
MTRIAKIVKSNSHVDYVARVVDELDSDSPPSQDDYGFAQFVAVPIAEDEDVVGVIYDTELVNPEYGSFGPRLSSRSDLKVLSPDFLHEQGVLLGILLLGGRARRTKTGAKDDGAWSSNQGMPRRVVPVGQDVWRMTNGEVYAFHGSADGSLQLHYFSQVLAHAGPFAVPLVEAVIEQLEDACTSEERQRLCVLKKSLVWQRTLGQSRL